MAAVHRIPFQIRPLSPLHIGSGNMLDPFRMLIKNNHAYYINTTEFAKYLSSPSGKKFHDILNTGDLEKIITFMYDMFDPSNQSLYVSKYGVSEDIQDHYPVQMKNPSSDKQIMEFVRTGYYQPIIPGSSIKGAFRTAIISALAALKREYPQTGDFEFRLLDAMSDTERYNKKDITKDPFKFIKFSDAPLPVEKMTIKCINRVYVKDNRKSIPFNYAEVYMNSTGYITSTELVVDSRFFEAKCLQSLFPPDEANQKSMLLRLLGMISKYYKDKLDKEMEVYSSSPLIKSYDAISKQMVKIGESWRFIAKLGKGSGQNYLSIGQSSIQPITKSSIKDDESGTDLPMGWCLFQYLSKKI